MNLINNDQHKSRILIVDDTPANLRLLSSILDGDYITHPANSGEQALRFIESTLPDLILLDARMPGLDGYQVCEKLKSNPRTHDIPVIFISAADEMSDKAKAFNVGAVDYIAKPFQIEEVLTRVGTHLSLRRLEKQAQATNVSNVSAELSQELVNNEILLHSALDELPVLVQIKDLMGRYLYISKGFERLLQASTKSILGKTCLDILPSLYADACQIEEQKLLAEQIPLLIKEVIPFSPNPRTCMSSKYLLHDQAKKPYAICCVSTAFATRTRGGNDMQVAASNIEIF